jgi:assimilatory nitrate reductase catalytic subunit
MVDDGWIRTTCPYCGVGCGVLARPVINGDGPVESADIKGDPEHPANFGRLCSKGAALGETLSLGDRLLKPIAYGRETDWPSVLDLVARRFREAIDAYGPDSVAIYASGQILTEDYYVANKLMKGFVGSANIDTNSRLCMASSVAGHKRAFGSDTVPGTYQDLELADLVVLVGSNLAWCHPVLYQRLTAAREQRDIKVVVIDPRRTATAEIADLHLAIAPGTDVLLFNGLLAHLAVVGSLDHSYIASFTRGFDETLAAASGLMLGEIAEATDLPASDIATFYELFAATPRVVTVYSQGVNQSSAGTDKVNAILNCHLATGRIGTPGCGPFSVTGQPNAMGGREVGGLSNMLAAHMELADPRHRKLVQNFWRSPRIAEQSGYKAVELFEAVRAGKIKALWIMGTNPVDSLPEADRVREALEGCPFVVVSDALRHTDTTAVAHVLLPSAAWGEKHGTVTNSERCISRQRAFLQYPGDTKPDWWQICEVAKRMGFADAFDYAGPAAIFAEYATLTGTENDGSRDLDISAFATISSAAYNAMEPFQWPRPHQTSPTNTRFFANGRFYTPDRKARFVATPFRGPASRSSDEYPLALNTGRVRDQWHTMTRTGKAPRLMSHFAEPFVELHPDDASAACVTANDLAVIESRHGRIVSRVVVTSQQKRGSIFVPMHWSLQYASAGRVDALMSAHVDPISGQPELKFTPSNVRRYAARWHAFAVTTVRPSNAVSDYWAVAPLADGGWRVELAGLAHQPDWEAFASTVLPNPVGRKVERLAYHDARAGRHRFALFADGRCAGLMFAAAAPLAIPRTWIVDQLGQAFAPAVRLRLLAGRPGADAPERGRIVCACLDVGQNEILHAIVAQNCKTVAAVGACVKAGTNCGSCRAEIGRLIHESRLETAV